MLFEKGKKGCKKQAGASTEGSTSTYICTSSSDSTD
jgi:hypothetical protein